MKAKAILTMAVVLVGWMVGAARAEDFSLAGIETLTVNKAYGNGTLYEQRKAWVVPGGSVDSLGAHGTSTVDISGGSVNNLNSWDSSTVNTSSGSVDSLFAFGANTLDISGGQVGYLHVAGTSTLDISGGQVNGPFFAHGSSTVNISGGVVDYLIATDSSTVRISGGQMTGPYQLWAQGTSTVNISGGQVKISLYARDTSTFTLHGRDFLLGTGLLLNGDEVLGTGNLSGKESRINNMNACYTCGATV